MDDDFEQWFLANGGHIHPHVEIASDPVTGRHMRVINGHNIPTESLVVSCPHELTISWLNIIKGSEPFLGQFALEEAYHAVNQVVLVRFFLVNEYLKGKESFWWPYIQTLIQPPEAHSLGTPLYYDDNDWAWIRGTNLEHAARKTESMWHLEYDEVIQSLVPMDGSHADEWTWPLYKWAATIMSSRCFPASALANNAFMKSASGSGDFTPDDLERGSPVMIPGIDLLNHRPSAKVTWQWTSTNCRLVINENLASGAKMENNYGQKSNEELILGYGFSIADNPADHCGLTVLSGTSQNQGSVTQGLSRRIVQPETRLEAGLKSRREPVQWVRLRNSIVDKVSKDERPSFEFSPGFLNGIATALCNHREKAGINTCPREQIDFSNVELSRLQLKMMATITMLLQRQHSRIVEQNPNVPQWPANEKQFYAARYRRGQLHIIQTVNEALLNKLSQLVKFNDGSVRDTRIVRLEHMLTESPGPFLTDYRAALNAGLGTRKASKIRERGWVECAFTLWICGVWLWGQSLNSDTEAIASPSLTSSIFGWLLFLKDAYPDIPVQHNSPASGNGHGAYPVLTDEEDMLLIDSYLQLIKVAVVKSPHSLYNDSACTASRLLWCLSIVREESVMCPSFEGNPGDDNDELVLFLESPENVRSFQC